MLTFNRVRSDERGFTMAELLVATVITLLILGGAVSITSQVQQGYRRQLEEVAAEQEGRYALDWVSRLIRSAGNNPYNIPPGDCPTANTAFMGVIPDPDGNTVHNDIRLQTDSNPPDARLGGSGGGANCNQPNEDVTVSYDATNRAITFLDNNLGGTATIRTEPVIMSLQFIYRDSTRTVIADPVTNSNNIMYIETVLTARARAAGTNTTVTPPITREMRSEVRIRGRNY